MQCHSYIASIYANSYVFTEQGDGYRDDYNEESDGASDSDMDSVTSPSEESSVGISEAVRLASIPRPNASSPAASASVGLAHIFYLPDERGRGGHNQASISFRCYSKFLKGSFYTKSSIIMQNAFVKFTRLTC